MNQLGENKDCKCPGAASYNLMKSIAVASVAGFVSYYAARGMEMKKPVLVGKIAAAVLGLGSFFVKGPEIK